MNIPINKLVSLSYNFVELAREKKNKTGIESSWIHLADNISVFITTGKGVINLDKVEIDLNSNLISLPLHYTEADLDKILEYSLQIYQNLTITK